VLDFIFAPKKTCFNQKYFLFSQRPPSSSLSYGGPMNDDVRSPGSQSTPGPLSAQPPPGLDSDPGESSHNINISFLKQKMCRNN
jgi:hypothetical protein